MMTATTQRIARRHDLDALRAIAMLLGILLHAVLSFAALPAGAWPVQDSQQHSGFAVLMSAVHGFRMPLFFLISGFFTAMLWRKRGLRALLVHRCKRIFLPLVLGMFTVVPLMWIVIIGLGVLGAVSDAGTAGSKTDASIWAAAKVGNVEAITGHLARGARLNDPDRALGVTPLSWAAMSGRTEAMQLLIEKGANVNARNRDQSTALHGAAFFGHSDAVRLLIEHGADLQAKNNNGDQPIDGISAPWATTVFVAKLTHMEVDRERIESGRKQVGQILREADATAETAGAAVDQEGNQENEALSGLVMLATVFPVFHHLWFLWFLCWLVVAFAVYAKLLDVMQVKSVPRRLVVSPLRYAWLIPLTMLPQAMMGLMYPNFGPDTSVGLIPMPHVLFYYAIFFFFGAMYFDCGDELGKLGRRWWITVPVALAVIFPLGYELAVGGLGLGVGAIDPAVRRGLAVVLQVLYVWLMTFGLIGLFRHFCSGESKAMRYISDSSYWLYLVHLPLIFIAQFLVRNWAMPAVVKCFLICAVVSALLLLSYQLFVRYTPIGTLLNGPRRRPERPVLAELVEQPGPATTKMV